MTNDAYREQWEKWHHRYEVSAYRIFRKALKESIAGLNTNGVTYENYKIMVPLNVQKEPILKAYIQVYTNVGLTHGRRVGFGINREMKRFNNDFFSQEFLDNILDWVRNNVDYRIRSVNETVSKRITSLIEFSFSNGYSVFEMRDYIFKTINKPDFTKYDALRIARTETTTAANHAATVAGEGAGIVLEKVWISTKDMRTRDPDRYKAKWSHVKQDGKAVGQFEAFKMKSTDGRTNLMMFPGDPAGSVDNIVMCRCTVAYRPMRDSEGFVITR